MSRSIHQYVVAALKSTDIEETSSDTGIPLSTLRKIRDGVIENPGIKSVEALYFYFRDREGRKLRRKAA